MTYADLAAHKNDTDTRVALLARVYDGEMPPLRIGDWVNAWVGEHPTLNEINLKEKTMLRRIKKNQKADTADVIPLPKSLVKFIKKREISGELFPNLTVVQIDQLLKKTYPNKKATPHYWRSYYTVNILSKLTNQKEIKERLRIMDHSIKTSAAYYNKQATTAYNNLLAP